MVFREHEARARVFPGFPTRTFSHFYSFDCSVTTLVINYITSIHLNVVCASSSSSAFNFSFNFFFERLLARSHSTFLSLAFLEKGQKVPENLFLQTLRLLRQKSLAKRE